MASKLVRTEIVMLLSKSQQQVFDSNARFRVVRHGRRWGGTTLCMHEALTFARDNRGSIVAVIVPFKRMATRINWPMLRNMVWPHEIMTVRENRSVHLKNGSTILMVNCEQPELLCGIGLDFAVFDVASMMSHEMWTYVVRPALADRSGKALFCFTPPHGRQGVERAKWLRDIERHDGVNWEKFYFTTYDAALIDAKEIDLARDELGEDIFRAEFLAEWPE